MLEQVTTAKDCTDCGTSFIGPKAFIRCAECGARRKRVVTIRVRPGEWEYFWRNVRVHATGCWQWQGPRDRHGRYGLVGREWGSQGAHRFSWALHNGPISREVLVLHQCDNPCCVNPAHLFLGTHSDNMRDREAKGRHCYRIGSQAASARLTEAQVIEIRRLASGHPRPTVTELARQFGVGKRTVGYILAGKTWKHVEWVNCA